MLRSLSNLNLTECTYQFCDINLVTDFSVIGHTLLVFGRYPYTVVTSVKYINKFICT
jgi:hypothetical protein